MVESCNELSRSRADEVLDLKKLIRSILTAKSYDNCKMFKPELLDKLKYLSLHSI